jgi:tetratricopeptide (TPR) repeat protein
MPPEQRAAWQAVRDGQPITAALDGRADLYALGVLLCEMLGGRLPESAGAARLQLRQLNPAVTSGLADVVGKCLADDARGRYQDAAALAEELGRHLQALPLRGVANRSWRERWRTWRTWRPHAPVTLGLLLAIALGFGVAGWHVVRQLEQGRAALREGQELIERQEYEKAGSAFQRGLALAGGMPFGEDLRRSLREQLQKVEAVQAARELHRFVERVRFSEGAAALPAAEARTVEEHCRALWRQRERIAELIPASADVHADTRDELLDLAILWTGLRVRLASTSEAAAARQEAIDTLAEAERLCGPSCVLYRERARHASTLGLAGVAEEAARRADAFPPRSAREHDALGRDLLARGDAAGASVHFERALALRPDDLWANYHGGRCAYLLGRHDEALAAFTACIALAPQVGWCHYNRGLTLVELGRHERALADFNRTLALDPRLADAALARGLLHYREKRYDAAVVDLRRALENGAKPAAVHHGLALVYLARGEQADAVRELNEALRLDPGHEPSRGLLERLRRPG